MNANIAERIEAMVNGERPAGTKDVDGRGYGRRAWGGPQGFGGRWHGHARCRRV